MFADPVHSEYPECGTVLIAGCYESSIMIRDVQILCLFTFVDVVSLKEKEAYEDILNTQELYELYRVIHS